MNIKSREIINAKECKVRMLSVKASVSLKECDTDWGAGMSYCQRQQFLGLEVAKISFVDL